MIFMHAFELDEMIDIVFYKPLFHVRKERIYKIVWIFLPTKKLLLFSVEVFSNLFSKNVDDKFRVLEEINWNPRAVNSYPFIRHSADNFTSCMLLVLFSDIIWLFNSQHNFSWQYNNVGEGKWDFNELNEVLWWIDSRFTHFVVHWA